VVCADGIAVFDALHRRRHAADAILTCWSPTGRTFDCCHSVSVRPKLAKLLARKPASAAIVYNEHTDEDGATVFRHACKLGFEGIEATDGALPVGSDWIKIKNPDSPAMRRHRAGTW